MEGCSSVCLIYKRPPVKYLQLKNYFTTKIEKINNLFKIQIKMQLSKKVNLNILNKNMKWMNWESSSSQRYIVHQYLNAGEL